MLRPVLHLRYCHRRHSGRQHQIGCVPVGHGVLLVVAVQDHGQRLSLLLQSQCGRVVDQQESGGSGAGDQPEAYGRRQCLGGGIQLGDLAPPGRGQRVDGLRQGFRGCIAEVVDGQGRRLVQEPPHRRGLAQGQRLAQPGQIRGSGTAGGIQASAVGDEGKLEVDDGGPGADTYAQQRQLVRIQGPGRGR
ncbi:hypothetical protein O1L60_45935 [Streptomyces diastatochromogenes]|nr:hypothetical protein [Streptomyces diastatochromogenes]